MAEKNYISNRQKAKEAGKVTYYSGSECPQGHVAERYTSNGTCVECAKKQSASRCEYYKKRYKQKNAEIKAKNKKRYEKTKTKRIEYNKQWAQNNPEKVRIYKLNNKHKRRTIELKGISAAQLKCWVDRQEKNCYWCGIDCSKGFEVDHYYPLSRGGQHECSNLVIACPHCNRTKSNKDPLQFAKEIGKVGEVQISPEMVK